MTETKPAKWHQLKPTHIEKERSPQEAHCGAKRGFVEPLRFAKNLALITCKKCLRDIERGRLK